MKKPVQARSCLLRCCAAALLRCCASELFRSKRAMRHLGVRTAIRMKKDGVIVNGQWSQSSKN
jgi:hypothetical protein